MPRLADKAQVLFRPTLSSFSLLFSNRDDPSLLFTVADAWLSCVYVQERTAVRACAKTNLIYFLDLNPDKPDGRFPKGERVAVLHPGQLTHVEFGDNREVVAQITLGGNNHLAVDLFGFDPVDNIHKHLDGFWATVQAVGAPSSAPPVFKPQQAHNVGLFNTWI